MELARQFIDIGLSEHEPGLRLRPRAPNQGRGRIQTAIRRAFIGHDILTTSQVFDFALARHRQDQWRRRHRWSVVRVLRQMCDPIGRADTPGRPWLWRLKTPAADGSSAPSD
jgi:hypothetical protein